MSVTKTWSLHNLNSLNRFMMDSEVIALNERREVRNHLLMQVVKLTRATQKPFRPAVSRHTSQSSLIMNTQGIVLCAVCVTVLLMCNQPSEAFEFKKPKHFGKRRFPYRQTFKVCCMKQERF